MRKIFTCILLLFPFCFSCSSGNTPEATATEFMTLFYRGEFEEVTSCMTEGTRRVMPLFDQMLREDFKQKMHDTQPKVQIDSVRYSKEGQAATVFVQISHHISRTTGVLTELPEPSVLDLVCVKGQWLVDFELMKPKN